MKAKTEAVVIVNSASISATAVTQAAAGETLSTTERLNRQLTSLNYTKETLNLSPDGIISYEWLKSLQKMNSNSELMLNLKMPGIIQCFHDSQSSCSSF